MACHLVVKRYTPDHVDADDPMAWRRGLPVVATPFYTNLGYEVETATSEKFVVFDLLDTDADELDDLTCTVDDYMGGIERLRRYVVLLDDLLFGMRNAIENGQSVETSIETLRPYIVDAVTGETW